MDLDRIWKRIRRRRVIRSGPGLASLLRESLAIARRDGFDSDALSERRAGLNLRAYRNFLLVDKP